MDDIEGTVVALGDVVYESGTPQEFNDCYNGSWGRHKDRTRPVPGNHDYGTQGAEGYFTYFGDAATPLEPGCTRDCKGYYSYNLGAWHVVALNSEIDFVAGSEQEQWLRADLAANPAACILAYWHRPRFTSGRYYARTSGHDVFQALYEYGADVVLAGHDHDYERFAPQNPAGEAEYGRGIRQFVVGTGGTTTRDFFYIQPNSEARTSETWGVLKLTLNPTSYDWEFLPIPGQTWTDSGSTDCVQLASLPPAPEGVTGVTIGATTEPTGEAEAVVDAPSTAPGLAPAESATSSTADGGEYIVKAGDSVSLIGLRFGVPWEEIAEANDLSGDYVIEIGQVLVIPGVDASAVADDATATATDEADEAPASTDEDTAVTPPAASIPQGSGTIYVVEAGDTLYSIAVRNALTWEELADANGLTETSILQIGQELVIPGAAAGEAEEETEGSEEGIPVTAEDAENL